MFTLNNFHVMASAIRAGRCALNWSQRDLAEKSGVSLPTVARLESANASPKLETVIRLVGAIEQGGVKYDWTQAEGFSLAYNPKVRHAVGSA